MPSFVILFIPIGDKALPAERACERFLTSMSPDMSQERWLVPVNFTAIRKWAIHSILNFLINVLCIDFNVVHNDIILFLRVYLIILRLQIVDDIGEGKILHPIGLQILVGINIILLQSLWKRIVLLII